MYDSVVFQSLYHIRHLLFSVVVISSSKDIRQPLYQGICGLLAFAQPNEKVNPLLFLRTPPEQDDAQYDLVPFQDALHPHVTADESSCQLFCRYAVLLVIRSEHTLHPVRLQGSDVSFHKAHQRYVCVGQAVLLHEGGVVLALILHIGRQYIQQRELFTQ